MPELVETEAHTRLLDAATMEQLTLPIPKLDGHVADVLVVSFSGPVELDRTLDDNLDLLNDLRLGQDVELVVTARVAGKGFMHTLKGEEESDHVGYQVKLKVHSMERAEAVE